MDIVSSPASAAQRCREATRPVVLVPTMGALHAGHRVLIERGRRHAGEGGLLVVSIFVNPTQFGPKEDYRRYPRTEMSDGQICREAGANLVFMPSARQMYGANHSTAVEESLLSTGLCGGTRPGHFRGVCTVVAKLFHIIEPDTAVFGLKDRQQLAVIRRMVHDLNFRVRILPVATVREPDGLALSSRNVLLSAAERGEAPLLRLALVRARELFRGGERNVTRLIAAARRILAQASLGRVDYLEIVDGESLQPLRVAKRGSVAALAVFFGKTRLIDNIDLR